jgi:NADH dehydrogenase FAD-containing subunit
LFFQTKTFPFNFFSFPAPLRKPPATAFQNTISKDLPAATFLQHSSSFQFYTVKMVHNIVILGGNFSGASTAHYLLRHVLPLLNSSESKASYKVTLVSPSDHTFFKVGAPRALIAGSKTDLLKPFASLPEAFSSYPTSAFTFILGSAIGLDEKTQTITVRTEKEETLHYDSLVIATGTTSNSALWTLHTEGFAATTSAFEDLNSRLDAAKTILVAGGGPAGVETTGEIAYKYKSQGKTIEILSGTTHLLPRLKHAGVSSGAESQLAALDVKTTHNLRVTSTSELPGGKTEVTLSDGSKKTVDLYIDATGGTPNSSFLPVSWLDSRQKVISESTTLRTPQSHIYALGDVASFSLGNVPDSTWAIPALGYSVYFDLTEGQGKGLKEKKYKQITASMGVMPIGPKGGVGCIFGWRVPSWFCWLLKSRTFMMENAPGVATGATVMKA